MHDCRGNFCLYCQGPHKTGREQKQEEEEETSLQINYRSPPIRKRDEPMKKQNRENEEKDSDTHRQETEESTEKLGERAIRKRLLRK